MEINITVLGSALQNPVILQKIIHLRPSILGLPRVQCRKPFFYCHFIILYVQKQKKTPLHPYPSSNMASGYAHGVRAAQNVERVRGKWRKLGAIQDFISSAFLNPPWISGPYQPSCKVSFPVPPDAHPSQSLVTTFSKLVHSVHCHSLWWSSCDNITKSDSCYIGIKNSFWWSNLQPVPF